MKLVYPQNGVYSYCKDYINSCRNNLLKAKNDAIFSIPSDFGYANYLKQLASKLQGYYNTIDQFDTKIRKVNANYNELDNDLLDDVKKSSVSVIESRDRMIY